MKDAIGGKDVTKMIYHHTFIENCGTTYEKPHLIFKPSTTHGFENKFVAFIPLTSLGGFVQVWKEPHPTDRESNKKIKGSQLKISPNTFILINASTIHSYGYGDDDMNLFDMLKLLITADKDKHPLPPAYVPEFSDYFKFLITDDANVSDIPPAGYVSPINFASV